MAHDNTFIPDWLWREFVGTECMTQNRVLSCSHQSQLVFGLFKRDRQMVCSVTSQSFLTIVPRALR